MIISLSSVKDGEDAREMNVTLSKADRQQKSLNALGQKQQGVLNYYSHEPIEFY